MFHLYPPIHPFASGFIRRGEHQVYVEQAGNPQGIPVLFVHGGPGAGCSEQSRRFFDPARFHIILFDQRGCGRSLPYGSLQDNHPQALIDDMEAIRESLDVSQWMLFGGSWGSTLSLLYAIAHPQRVSAMVLRGIFLSRQQDFDWLYSPQGGASLVFPEHYQQFIAPLGGVTDSEQVLEGYWQRLSSDNELERSAAAKSWALWEAHLMQLLPDPTVWEQMSNLQHAVALARLECHYFRAATRLPENFIVQNAAVLQAIPVRIVHGRYDMICPFENAWQLCQVLPQAALQVVPNAGHSSMEPGITDGLIRALLELTEAYPL